ncbi:MAG: CAP domain-containing protein [Pleurocapsa sp.]
MSSELINQVLELTNTERAKAGLKPLKLNSQLSNAAQTHSNNMAKDDFFSHTGADGSNIGNRIQNAGYQYSTAGENIAAGQRTAEQVVEGWMNSPGHRANILNADFTEIGIGHAFLENDTGSVNYNYYWTQVFAAPLSTNNNGGTNQETINLGNNNNDDVAPIENNDSAPTSNLDNNSTNLDTNLAEIPVDNANNNLTRELNEQPLTGGNDSWNFSVTLEQQTTNEFRGLDWQQIKDIFASSGLADLLDNYQDYNIFGIDDLNESTLQSHSQESAVDKSVL